MKQAFIHANVIDVLEKKTINDCTVLVKDGIITDIIPGGAAPQDCEVIDLGGKYLAPGLFNCHVHIVAGLNPDGTYRMGDSNHSMIVGLQDLQEYVKSGVVFVRDVGAWYNVAIDIRNKILSGDVKNAPDMIASGNPICMTGGTTWHLIGYQADGEDGVRTAARLMLRNGADFIKLMGTGGVITPGNKIEAPHFNEKELRAAVEEAHNAGVHATCHVHNNTGALNAIRAGVDCLEHGTALTDETIALMVEKNVALDATLAATYSIIRNSKTEEFTRKAKVAAASAVDTFKRAHNAGVLCISGTDCGTEGCMHQDSALELVLMVNLADIDPYEAFKIATYNSAKMMGVLDRLGSVTVGKEASFAVYENDPIANIEAVQDCCMTIKRGDILWTKQSGFKYSL